MVHLKFMDTETGHEISVSMNSTYKGFQFNAKITSREGEDRKSNWQEFVTQTAIKCILQLFDVIWGFT